MTEFCRERGVSQRNAMLVGLCVEEITHNIIQHGFSSGKGEHNVDLRLVLDEDSRVIRIRDNCVNFDPTKYMEMHESDDPTAHIGLEEGAIDKVLTTNLIYQHPETLKRDYYVSVDMSEYLASLVDTLNHNASMEKLITPSEKITNKLKES